MMKAGIHNFFKYIQQASQPIMFLVLVFVVTVGIRMIQEEWRDKYFDETEFGEKYLVAHGMACGFALIYSCILYFIPENGSGTATFLMLSLFYIFMILIIKTENKENGGYIENFEGASGAIMYITSVLSPIVFVEIHLLLGGICWWMYKRENNEEVWKKRIIRRLIDCVEALAASIIIRIFKPNSFIENLWLNSSIIAVFTLAIPFLNNWLYRRFSLD